MKAATTENNPLEEIWRIREEIGAEHGYDVDRLFAAMREKEKTYGRRVVQRIPWQASEGESQGQLRTARSTKNLRSLKTS